MTNKQIPFVSMKTLFDRTIPFLGKKSKFTIDRTSRFLVDREDSLAYRY